jgi:WD40 repeat protein
LESGAQIGEDWKDEKAEKSGVQDIALSPNGKTVVSGCRDGKVRLWDVKTGKVIKKWTGHTERMTSVCWSAGGNRVVSGSWDGTARVWNVKTGKTILEIKTRHESVWAVKYSSDDTQIATGGYNEDAANIWDAKTGKLIKILKHNSMGIVKMLRHCCDCCGNCRDHCCGALKPCISTGLHQLLATWTSQCLPNESNGLSH